MSRLGPKDLKSPCGAMGDSHGARKSKSTWLEKALVKSRRKALASSSRLPVRWECERLEGVVALDGG